MFQFREHGLKSALVTSALVVVSMVAAACGGTSTGSSSASSAGGAAASSAASAAASAPASTAATAEASAAGSAAPAAKDITIAMLPKATNIAYFTPGQVGAQRAADELGAKLVYAGPSEPDVNAQNQYVDTLVQQGVNGITVSALDAGSIVPALKRAQARGVAVTTYDSDSSGGRTLFIHQAADKAVAEALVKITSDAIGGEGQIAIISGVPTAAQQNAWVDEMKKVLAQPEYAGLELVDVVFGETNQEKTTQVAQGLLQQYPDLKGFIVPDAVSLPAVGQVLESKNLVGKVMATGLSIPSLMSKYVKDGTIPQFALWNVDKLGYLSYYATYLLVTGQITGAPGETFTAGTLGEFTVGENGVVDLGDPMIFDKSNIDQFKF